MGVPWYHVPFRSCTMRLLVVNCLNMACLVSQQFWTWQGAREDVVTRNICLLFAWSLSATSLLAVPVQVLVCSTSASRFPLFKGAWGPVAHQREVLRCVISPAASTRLRQANELTRMACSRGEAASLPSFTFWKHYCLLTSWVINVHMGPLYPSVSRHLLCPLPHPIVAKPQPSLLIVRFEFFIHIFTLKQQFPFNLFLFVFLFYFISLLALLPPKSAYCSWHWRSKISIDYYLKSCSVWRINRCL